MKKLLFITLIFTTVCSCNNLTTNSTDNKFVGLWKYYSSSLEKTKPNDGSMDDYIATIKK